MSPEIKKGILKVKLNGKTLERKIDSEGLVPIFIKEKETIERVPLKDYIQIMKRKHPEAIIKIYQASEKIPFYRRFCGINGIKNIQQHLKTLYQEFLSK